MINRMMPIKVSTVFSAVVLAAIMSQPVPAFAEGTDGPLHLVSGTLLKLDLTAGRGLLRTDLGRPIYFDVPKAYLFENVIVGARIALRLDDQGRALKVMDTAIPDLVAEPDQSVAVSAPDSFEQ
ncbi:MAG TPA: hypothetical protein VF019_09050 [Nitrospira sp.]